MKLKNTPSTKPHTYTNMGILVEKEKIVTNPSAPRSAGQLNILRHLSFTFSRSHSLLISLQKDRDKVILFMMRNLIPHAAARNPT